MAYHIDCIQEWEGFNYQGTEFSLKHLSAHELRYQGNKKAYTFVVTYGLHCFAKNDSMHSIPIEYSDSRETRTVDLERYHASKHLKGILGRINEKSVTIYETTTDKYFTIEVINNLSEIPEAYKICLAVFKENRLLRMHVLSSFFVREGEGSPDTPITRKGFSFYKMAMDVERKQRSQKGPKEVFNKP